MKLKKITFIFLILILVLPCSLVFADDLNSSAASVGAEGAILIEASTRKNSIF